MGRTLASAPGWRLKIAPDQGRRRGMAGSSHWEASAPTRYPDPDVVVLDPRFQKIFIGNSCSRRIATGFDFTEGPVWFGDGRYLLFSDIPNDRILRWGETTGETGAFRSPSRYAH